MFFVAKVWLRHKVRHPRTMRQTRSLHHRAQPKAMLLWLCLCPYLFLSHVSHTLCVVCEKDFVFIFLVCYQKANTTKERKKHIHTLPPKQLLLLLSHNSLSYVLLSVHSCPTPQSTRKERYQQHPCNVQQDDNIFYIHD